MAEEKMSVGRPLEGELVRINMLGEFTLQVGDHSIGDSSNRGHQVWSVLEYLVSFRKRDILNGELVEALWPGDESENPINALKNLIYRIRTMLTDSGIPDGKDMVVYRRGSYSWNNQLNTWVDVEAFEQLLKQAGDERFSAQHRVDIYRQALALYKGDFLPKSSFEQWVVPLSTYYHNLYVKGVQDTVKLLFLLEQPQEVEKLCSSAIVIDQFEERFHESLIRALIAQGEQQQALQHYEQVTDLFYRELGVSLSDRVRSLYRDIVKSISHVETDLEVVKEDLQEADRISGAFVCDYEVFKNVYRLEARSVARSGQAIFIGMLTVTTRDGMPPDKKLLKNSMDRLLLAARKSLRRMDVISRFSPTQYVLMLPSLTYENGLVVLERVCKHFRRDNPRMPVQVCSNLLPLDPVK